MSVIKRGETLFESAPGTLSDREFLKAAAAEPKLASVIKKHFKKQTDDLLAALREGLSHPLESEVWNLIVDTLLNEGDVLSEFVANGDFGAYPIQVAGIGNLCYVHAPEFGTVGVFPSIGLAEDYIIVSWADNLESTDPTRPGWRQNTASS